MELNREWVEGGGGNDEFSYYRFLPESHMEKLDFWVLVYSTLHFILREYICWYISQGSGQHTETTQDILIRKYLIQRIHTENLFEGMKVWALC